MVNPKDLLVLRFTGKLYVPLALYGAGRPDYWVGIATTARLIADSVREVRGTEDFPHTLPRLHGDLVDPAHDSQFQPPQTRPGVYQG